MTPVPTSVKEAASEAELKEECWQLMRRIAHKRSTYPQHCAKYASKILQCKIDHLMSAATKLNMPATSDDDDWKITDDLTEDSYKKFEKLSSLHHFNTISDSLQEAKAILKVLNQISQESTCETNLITTSKLKSND